MDVAVPALFGLVLFISSYFHQQLRLQLLCSLSGVFYFWVAHTARWYIDFDSDVIPYYQHHLEMSAVWLAAILLVWGRWFSALIAAAVSYTLFAAPMLGINTFFPYHATIWYTAHTAYVATLLLPFVYPSMQLRQHPLGPYVTRLVRRFFNWRVAARLNLAGR